MFLKSLELYGFKSFAQRTKLIFKPGVTAIVGPNGCGKSNIVDALRWVLGESNARSLRGDVMNDVIFAGSEGLKPLGMAEVEIVIANEDNLLPIEYSEISVKRRLYRSGESEYFINKKNVRLKDIHELFADTGIGKTAYSIMEQGNIDMLLSTHPEERMAVFEEAAGITRYKMRIKESYRKLNSTDENLVRLDLIINEVEKEYRSLERQAEKARRYRELKLKEREYERLYSLARIRSLRDKLNSLNSSLELLLNKRIKLQKSKESYEASIRSSIERIREKEKEITGTKNTIYRLESEISTIDSKISHLEDRIEDLENRLKNKRNLLEKLHNNKGIIEKDIENLEKESDVLSEVIESQSRKLKEYRGEVAILDDRIKKLSLDRKQVALEINSVSNELSNLRQLLKEAIDNLLKELDKVKKRLIDSEKGKREAVSEINRLFEKIKRGIESSKRRIDELELFKDSGDFKSYTGKIVADLSQIADKLKSLESNFNSVFVIQENITEAIFGKEGIHTQKELIEEKIEKLLIKEEELKNKEKNLQSEIESARKRREEFLDIIGNISPELAGNREKLNHVKSYIKKLKEELQKNQDSVDDLEFDIENIEKRIISFKNEIDELSREKEKLMEKKATLVSGIEKQNREIDESMNKIKSLERNLEETRKKVEKLSNEIESIELKKAEIGAKIDSIIENYQDKYGRNIEENTEPGEKKGNTVEASAPDVKAGESSKELTKEFSKKFSVEELREMRNKIKDEIRSLGHVNLLALEELDDVKKRYDYLTAQRNDLIKAKEDLNQIVKKTMEVSKRQFNSSLKEIKENFDKIFKRLFNGGKTDLYLTNRDDIFQSGIEIVAVPPGKRTSKKTLLSGGEKTLTAIAILFSIFMVKPSPFCFLDEVDHDLDEENIVRFLNLLKEFTDTTQFVIITHNRRTMEFADVIYGVTTEQPGVSKVVSLDMAERRVG